MTKRSVPARSPSLVARSRSIRTTRLFVVLLATVGVVGSAEAQQNIDDVLSFLLTNRSIRTDEPTQDEQAAAATRDAISRFLLTELSTLPTLSSASGFTYRLDPNLGGVRRSSDSFGPFFVERSLTLGRLRPSLGISYQNAVFHQVDGRNLRDGTLVATASRLRGESQPFDVETLALELRTQTTTLSGALGVTDRFDVNVAIPLVRLTMSGTRVDTLRGVSFPQAQANASASGVGDVLIRSKYNLVRRAGGGLAVGFDWKVPTGDAENLLGAGKAVARPRVLASLEGSRLGLHGDVGYAFGGLSRQLDYGTALTVALYPRLTLVGELLGRRLATSGRLTEIAAAHPRLVGVETIRLSAVRESTDRVLAIAGAKWNVAASMLLSATVLRPMTEAGLTPEWIPSLAVEYSFDR
jgi:hypothetical protein